MLLHGALMNLYLCHLDETPHLAIAAPPVNRKLVFSNSSSLPASHYPYIAAVIEEIAYYNMEG